MTPKTTINNEPRSDPLSRRKFLFATGAVATIAATPLDGIADLTGQYATTHNLQFPDLAFQPQPDNAVESSITRQTLARAQKVAALDFTPAEQTMMLDDVRRAARGYAQRRKTTFPNGLAPATTFDPRLPGMQFTDQQRPIVRSNNSSVPRLPANDEDIAYAPLTVLSRWVEQRKITSTRLTKIYLDRIKTYGPKLECIITITKDRALRQAARADREISAGKYKGPLHGIPWGAKDLFDTAQIKTTWGATPYKTRVPDTDAAVVQKLDNAGAVLVAKTTLGALAYGDQWFAGRTNNPFDITQGSSGSSAGSASGTVAGLFGFSLGTETLGSIVSPSMRCGATGLRPTFGRVPRTGAMALCWSLDKVGPLCRSAEDCALVLDAIKGHDSGDPASRDMPYNFDATQPIRNLRIGYDPAWFEGRRANDIDRAALEALKTTGVQLVEIKIPDWNYRPLRTILSVEAAAAFEELTLTNRDDELVWQEPQAWPNTFRETWFVPAIELIQAQRFRRQVCEMMVGIFENVDALFGPSFASSLLLITNNTGHPSITLRAGFRENNHPHGVTFWGRLFDEGTICRLAMALETKLNVATVRPTLG